MFMLRQLEYLSLRIWDEGSERADVAAFFIRRRVVRGYDPETDDDYAPLIDRVLAG